MLYFLIQFVSTRNKSLQNFQVIESPTFNLVQDFNLIQWTILLSQPQGRPPSMLFRYLQTVHCRVCLFFLNKWIEFVWKCCLYNIACSESKAISKQIATWQFQNAEACFDAVCRLKPVVNKPGIKIDLSISCCVHAVLPALFLSL